MLNLHIEDVEEFDSNCCLNHEDAKNALVQRGYNERNRSESNQNDKLQIVATEYETVEGYFFATHRNEPLNKNLIAAKTDRIFRYNEVTGCYYEVVRMRDVLKRIKDLAIWEL